MEILKIAVTGSAGSGKSIVCEAFEKIGLAVLDCDIIARQVVEPGTPGFNAVVGLFGKGAVLESGELNRPELRQRIINDPSLRKKMEDILHPQILTEMKRQMNVAAQKGFKSVAVEVPLLFESGMDKYFDITLAVVGAKDDLVQRIVARDGVAAVDAGKMVDLQMPQEEKIKRADHVIKNSGSVSELFETVENLYKEIEKEFLTT